MVCKYRVCYIVRVFMARTCCDVLDVDLLFSSVGQTSILEPLLTLRLTTWAYWDRCTISWGPWQMPQSDTYSIVNGFSNWREPNLVMVNWRMEREREWWEPWVPRCSTKESESPQKHASDSSRLCCETESWQSHGKRNFLEKIAVGSTMDISQGRSESQASLAKCKESGTVWHVHLSRLEY